MLFFARSVTHIPTLAGKDGNTYFDIGVRLQSFASRQQLAAGEQQRLGAVEKEFDRALLTTIGVANQRVYQLRVQAPYKRFMNDTSLYDYMAESFRCKQV